MNIAKLVARGRVERVTKTDGEGRVWLVGYKRRCNSRKAGQEWTLKKPLELDAAGRVVPDEPIEITGQEAARNA